MPTITVNDELTFEVDDNFVNLPPEVQQRIVDEAVIQDASEGAGRAFMKGMLFNFRDEITAILAEPTSFVTGGEEYKQRLTRERALESAFQAQRPILSTTSELGGGFATPAGVLGGAVKGGSILYKGLKAGLAGAGMGALAGAGMGETAEERLAGAKTGGVIGAVVAPVATAAVPVASKVGGAIGAAGKAATMPFARIGEAVAREPADRAARMVARRLKQAGVTGKELEALKKSPKPEAIADIDSAGVQSLSRLVAQSGGRGAELARSLNARQFGDDAVMGAAERIERDLISAGAPKTSVRESRVGLDAIKREKAGALYEKAFQRPVPPKMREELTNIYDRISASGALNNAKKIADAEGRPFTGDPLSSMTFQDMQYIQRSLRGLSSQQYKAGNSELGKAVKELRDEFVDVIDSYNPDFKQARGVYAGAEASRAAMEAGENFRKMADVGEIKEFVKNLTPDELHHFRVGVAQSIRRDIEKAADGRNLSDVLANSRRKLRQLSEAFPAKGFKQLEEALEKEGKMARTRGKVLGGSQTFQTGQAAEEVAAEELGLIQRMMSGYSREGLSGGVAPLAPAGQRALMGVGDETSEQLGRLLFSTDPASRARAIEKVRGVNIVPQQPPQPLGLLGQAGLGVQSLVRPASRGLLFQAPTMVGREMMEDD
mgnify:CR=1 FL=1